MYVRHVEGCQMHMVSGEGECGHYKAPTIGTERSVEVVLSDAIGKVRSFGFIGLTEEWARRSVGAHVPAPKRPGYLTC